MLNYINAIYCICKAFFFCLFQMEKYSKHLEVLVAERTQDLMHEKQKTDRLLYSMTHKHTDTHIY